MTCAMRKSGFSRDAALFLRYLMKQSWPCTCTLNRVRITSPDVLEVVLKYTLCGGRNARAQSTLRDSRMTPVRESTRNQLWVTAGDKVRFTV
jgi:hypothetical protein